MLKQTTGNSDQTKPKGVSENGEYCKKLVVALMVIWYTKKDTLEILVINSDNIFNGGWAILETLDYLINLIKKESVSM